MSTLTIGFRFRGPEASANGGYFAGSVAARAGRTVTVRLLEPPPLDTPMQVIERPDGGLEVMLGERRIGEARPAALALELPAAPR